MKLEEVIIPNWFKDDELVTLTTIVDKQDTTQALLLAGDNLEQLRPYNPVVRVYLLTLQDGKYELTKEMSAITFNSKEEAISFSNKFPNYLAHELFIDLFKKNFNIAI